jgi:hypothetical protein
MFHDRPGAAGHGRSIVLFEHRIGCLEQLDAWDHDDIEPARVRRLVTVSKYLSDQSFSTISADGVPQLFGRHDPQAGFASWPSRDDHCQKPSPAALAVIENLLVFRPPTEPAALREPPAGDRSALRAWIHHCVTVERDGS